MEAIDGRLGDITRAVLTVNHLEHQRTHAAAMVEGLKRHGIATQLMERDRFAPCDFAVIWGWRQQNTVRAAKKAGVPVLVMERGFLPDRMAYTSMGWGGLNGRATWPECPDKGERFEKYFGHLMQPWKPKYSGDYVLVCGQVVGDASIIGVDIDRWANGASDVMGVMWERPIVYRKHPLSRRMPTTPVRAKVSSNKLLADDLKGAMVCVTYNSNSAVESVLAGVPTITCDEGSMAWPVTSHVFEKNKIVMPEREPWAHKLAWCQWTLDEIRSGAAWEHARTAIPAMQEACLA